MKILADNSISISGINFLHSVDDNPPVNKQNLHNHNDTYEFFLFIQGDSEFYAEGSIYNLKPYDIVIIRNDELHTIVHKSAKTYERIVIGINPDFFTMNNCWEYDNIFTNRQLGCQNLIPADITVKYGIKDLIYKLEKYMNDGCDAVASGVFIEIMHLVNKYGSHSEMPIKNQKYVREIILYINENLTDDISLENISEHFFINKQYLCKIFKKATGYTINQYITHKRILLTNELSKSGKSLTDAAMEAGFGSYSNYYRAKKKVNVDMDVRE